MTDSIALPETTDDAFLGGALKLLQPKAGYRAGVDAVLLAASIPVLAGRAERCLDAGGGVGTVAMCVAVRCADAQAVILEREEVLVELARQNANRNTVADRVTVFSGDILAPASELAGLGLVSESFDHVFANPPFHAEGQGTPSPVHLKSAAHAIPEADLDQWGRLLARMAAPGGTATIIHKAEALGKVIGAMSGRFGGLRILPIYPRPDTAAIRVIVQGEKGSRAPMVILPGLVLHGEGNAFTAAADAILRAGAGLPLDIKR